MPTYPTDFIQDGVVVTLGADGKVADTQHLNPQQLATDETLATLLDWLKINVPEGNPWSSLDLYLGMSDANHKYNCPCWQVVAANKATFSAGLVYFNLFNYSVPTAATVMELHTLASAPAPVS